MNENFLKICKSKGVTHIITGIESLNNAVLKGLNKSPKKDWSDYVKRTIDLCNKYSILLRPVVMVNPPNTSRKDLYDMVLETEQWVPENNIELLLSGNSGKRGQAFRTNGALSPILSVRSTALYR